MKYILFTASVFVLAACGGGETGETTVAELTSAEICNELVSGDAEIASEMAEDGVTPSAVCACFGTTVDAMGEAERALHLTVMKAVSAIRTSDGVGVEGAAEKLEEQLRAGTGGHSFTEDDFQQTGRLLDRVGGQLEDGGCAAG